MASALLITLREGLEAALIISIILAYLTRIGQGHQSRLIWQGFWSAIATSAVVGAILFFTIGEFTGAAEKIFEGIAMVTAAALLTWMIFWMRGRAQSIRSDLEAGVDQALQAGTGWPIFVLAYISVAREGIETVVFLFAASREDTAVATFTGAAIGLVISVGIGVALYRGIRVLNLKTLFQVTGLLLILFAAGVFAHGIHEFQEAGTLPVFVKEAWNTNHILHDKGTVGSLLRAAFGYNGNPTLLEAVAYFGYLLPALFFYFRPQSGAAANTAHSVAADGGAS